MNRMLHFYLLINPKAQIWGNLTNSEMGYSLRYSHSHWHNKICVLFWEDTSGRCALLHCVYLCLVALCSRFGDRNTSKSDVNFVDPGNTDHMVAMTQLREQLASLKKQLAEKEKVILDRDKKVRGFWLATPVIWYLAKYRVQTLLCFLVTSHVL